MATEENPTAAARIAYIIAANNPKTTFAVIPAMETHLIPVMYFLKFNGLTGTGFAQPIPKIMNHKNPDRLRCLKGLRVSLPVAFGVISPILYATNACENSCTDNEIMNTKTVIKNTITASIGV